MAERYRIDRLLGQGGMGLVYAAVHTYTGRKLAIKILLPRFQEEPAALKRFFQEAKSTASLQHPNVIEILDSGEDESGDAYIAMELLEGENLAQRLERSRMTPTEALELALPIVDALRLAHENGIVHRDIKPENIFLHQREDGSVTPKVKDEINRFNERLLDLCDGSQEEAERVYQFHMMAFPLSRSTRDDPGDL